MPKLIIGLVGQAGSGKGTVGKILKRQYHAETFTFSDLMRGVLNQLDLELSRDHFITLSMTLRNAFGQDIFAKAMEAQVQKSTADMVVVDGIRRKEDIQHLKNLPFFHLVEVFAPPKSRFERLKKRGEKTEETSMTWEAFQEMSNRETEQTIASVAQNAEYRIDNSNDFIQLEKQINACIQPLWTSASPDSDPI